LTLKLTDSQQWQVIRATNPLDMLQRDAFLAALLQQFAGRTEIGDGELFRTLPLSEQLAELSVHAKHAEDALAAAKKEAHDKVVARTEQARAAATAAAEKVNRDIQSAKDTATRSWSAVRAKIATDINNLKADVAHKKHDLDAKLADKHADQLEWEAGFAFDYAISSVEQAEWAVLDAVAARVQAQKKAS
jgi:hypothetical protein